MKLLAFIVVLQWYSTFHLRITSTDS